MRLELQNVSKTVGADKHLYPLDLTLSSGLNVLLGPTLAGKTLPMRLVAGLDKLSTGRVVLDGQDVTRTQVQRRSVAFVYQEFINYPSLSVFENIASPLRIKGGLSRAQLTERVQEVAKLMRIDPFLGRLERIGMAECSPISNEEQDAQYWFDQPGAPRAPLENEKPQGETVPYDELLQAWKEGRVR